MKHLTTLALFLGLALTAFAQSPYDRYYENLPIEVEHVTPVLFPDTQVNMKIYFKRFQINPAAGTLCTEAFQTAIDELSKAGGGHIIVPRGTWKTGPIQLKSNIDLHLSRGATILMTEDKSQYILPDKKGNIPSKARACISASKVENIGITGEGTIDGQGFFWRPLKQKKVVGKARREEDKQVWDYALSLGGRVINNGKEDIWYPFSLNKELGIPNIAATAEDQETMRYHLVNITDSKNVLIEGVTLRNSPKFHLVPARIQNLIIDNVTIDCPWWAQNGDAMDIGNTQVCLVVNCKVSAGDDGICMKGGVGQDGLNRGPNRDFVIRYDTVFEAHGGFVIGSEFSGGMERMVVKDCFFDGTDIGLRFKSAPGRGGHCKDIFCEDIVMRNILEHAVLFESGYADKAVGRSATASDNKDAFFPDWAHFTFRRITCANLASAVYINGMKGAPVHDLLFDEVRFMGVRKNGLNLTFAEDITFTNCTISGGQGDALKNCKHILFNGQEK